MKYPAFGLSLHSLPRRNGLSLWLPPYRVSFSSPSTHACFSKEPSLKKTNLRAHGGLEMRLGLGRVGRVRAGWLPAYVVGTATAVVAQEAGVAGEQLRVELGLAVLAREVKPQLSSSWPTSRKCSQ